MVQGRAPRAVLAWSRRGARRERASLAVEADIALLLNGRRVARLAASPLALDELAVGHLVLAGRLRAPADLRGVRVLRWRWGFHVAVQARARAAKPPAPRLPRGPRLAPPEVLALMKGLLEGAALYREGGGVHTSALATPEGDALLAADIGKVNTLDRLAGQAFLQGADPHGMVLLTTGRLTGAMVQRALAMGCPVLVSHSGPTTHGLALAQARGATLVGYARGGGFNVYCHAGRIARPRVGTREP